MNKTKTVDRISVSVIRHSASKLLDYASANPTYKTTKNKSHDR